MKVVQVCPGYHPNIGGVETRVKEISERLMKKGFEVEILTTDPSEVLPKEEVINGICVRRFKSWAPNEAYYFSNELRKYLLRNSNDYEIMHAHNYHAFPAFYAAQTKDRKGFFITSHYHGKGHSFFRSLLHIPYKFIAKKMFEKANRIICVSNYEKSLVMKNFKINDERIAVIPNGLNLEEFKGLRKRKKGVRVILYVGRLEKYKGAHYLIKAFSKSDSNMVLEIVGKGSYKKNLAKLAIKLRVEERVKFFQDLPRNELLQRYADADLFVLLSKREAYGISVAEALALGTPCIVTRTSALREWIDNRNCFGIDYPINLNELRNLMNDVIGKDVTGLKLPDWNEITEKLVSVYEHC